MSNKTQHTPGPWIAKHFHVYPKNDIGDKLHICNTLVCGDVLISGIAQGVHSKAGDYLKEWEANARLIAAAPELLYFLKEAHELLLLTESTFPQADYHGQPLWKAIAETIAKAEGGEG